MKVVQVSTFSLITFSIFFSGDFSAAIKTKRAKSSGSDKRKEKKMRYCKYETVLRRVKTHDIRTEYNLKDCNSSIDFGLKVMRLQRYPQEHVAVVSLTSKLDIIGYTDVSIGDISSAYLCPRDIFRTAILQNASCVIIYHNHPSGKCKPSKEDIDATSRIVKAGEILGIPVIDHIIIGAGRGLSLKEYGIM